MGSVSLDDDQLRSRWIQGTSPVSFRPMEIPPPVSGGISPLSSIREAEKGELAPQNRPTLPSPRLHPMLRLAQLQDEFGQSLTASNSLFKTDLAEQDRQIQELDANRSAALQKEIEAARSRDTWGTLGVIAEYAGSAGMVAIGWSTGGVGGAMLLAAGVIGIGNRVIHDTNLLQPALEWMSKSEEKQQAIKAKIEMGAFFLQLGFGLAGGMTVWRAASDGATVLSTFGKTKSTLTAASSLFGATAQVGKAVHQKHVSNAFSDRAEINRAITLANQTKSEEATRMSSMLEQSSQIDKAVQHAITDFQVEMG